LCAGELRCLLSERGSTSCDEGRARAVRQVDRSRVDSAVARRCVLRIANHRGQLTAHECSCGASQSCFEAGVLQCVRARGQACWRTKTLSCGEPARTVNGPRRMNRADESEMIHGGERSESLCAVAGKFKHVAAAMAAEAIKNARGLFKAGPAAPRSPSQAMRLSCESTKKLRVKLAVSCEAARLGLCSCGYSCASCCRCSCFFRVPPPFCLLMSLGLQGSGLDSGHSSTGGRARGKWQLRKE
jgi:hypothetical protein